MNDDQVGKLVDVIGSHGDQLGGNLVHVKRFLERQQKEQQNFLAEQRNASDRSQARAHSTAKFSAFAAGAAAVAALIQAYVALSSLAVVNCAILPVSHITALPQPHTAAAPG